MPITQILFTQGSSGGGGSGGGGGAYLPWTIEWFQKSNATQIHSNPRVFAVGSYPTEAMGFSLESSYIGWVGETAVFTNTSITHNTWQHWAIVSNGSNLGIYKDGQRLVYGAREGDIVNTTGDLYIGISANPNTGFKGWISNFRIVKGTAMYNLNSTSFTVPNVPLAAVSGTELLLKAPGDGFQTLDGSGNNRTPWGSGGIAWSNDSPFTVFSPISAIPAVRDYGGNPHVYYFTTANYPDLANVQPGWFWREASSGNLGQVTQVQIIGENTLISIIPSTTLSEASGSFEQPSSMGGSIETFTDGSSYGFIAYSPGAQWALDFVAP